MNETHWTLATLETRIANPRTRQRHSGGSPDPKEIAAYAAGLGRTNSSQTALVFGMTPELRALALARFTRLISVDSNPQAIALYRAWIQSPDSARETIIEANWFSLPTVVSQPVAAVLADGVFGNLPDAPAHQRLLEAVATVLSPTGRFVTRMAMIPDGFDPAEHCADRLLQRFRAREIDEAELGFGMRLVGHHETCYDVRTALLDNAKLFARCEARYAAGELTEAEHAAIRRYYFGGFNCILSQREWERLLWKSGWEFEIHRCRGKAWYDYYPVYSCWRR